MFKWIDDIQSRLFEEYGTKDIEITIDLPHSVFYSLVDKEFVNRFDRTLDNLPPQGVEVFFASKNVKVICHGNRSISSVVKAR